MSQSSSNSYQTSGEYNASLKNGSTAMVNGQPSTEQYPHNGIQTPNSTPAGTPLSQLSRDPSRETSRDPSPTQYIHNHYRPQIRPPNIPISSQSLPQTTLPTSATTPDRNVQPLAGSAQSEYGTRLPTMSSQHSANQVTSAQSNIAGYQKSVNKLNPPNPNHRYSPTMPTEPLIRTNGASHKPVLSDPAQQPSYVKTPNQGLMHSTQNVSNQNPLMGVDKPLSYTQLAAAIPVSTSQQPVSQVRGPPAMPNVFSSPPAVRSQLQNISQGMQNNHPPMQIQPHYTQPSNLGTSKNLFGGLQNTGMNITYPSQNIFGNAQQVGYSQSPAQGAATAGQVNRIMPQQYPPPPNIQSNVSSNQLNMESVGYTEQSVPSQRMYPPGPYGTQGPPSAATLSGPTFLPQQTPTSMQAPRQYYPTVSSNMVPPLQQEPPAQMRYDARPQYPNQMQSGMSDNMSKRYPNHPSYPDQMNQLNNQMSDMSVTQVGFNKIWGMEAVDLLQCRNILPPEKIEAPKIKLPQEVLNSMNCSPDIFRCTLTKIPESNSLLQKSRLPLGVLIHPFKDLNNLPVIQCNTIVRCRACRTYINPFVYFIDTKRWKCNICYRVNDLPDEFQFDPVTKSFGDPSRRPEARASTIEYIAPSEYMLRPPQPAVYLFVLDVSRLAVESGYLSVVCNIIGDELSRIPGDSRTQVGFLAVDSAVHFFSMPENVSQPHEMIMLDIDDVFLPCPDNLIAVLKEREELFRDLLAQLPTKFQGTHDTNCALGAALQAAFKLMSATGGRVTVFQTCLPNIGPGALQPREDPNVRSSKEVPHLNPATDFYKRLALDCSSQQIAIDLFLLNCQYSDLSTLSGMCKFSGGCIYHLPLFRITKPQHADTLERMLRRYISRKIGFEAVMRIRCTRGLSIHTFHGNFFVRSTDLLSLPNTNPDTGYGMQVSIEENLSDVQSVCFQAALLYTSSKGERRIRVHTLCLPTASTLTDILYSADQQCIVGLLAKMAVDRAQQASLSDSRDALLNAAIDVLSAYKLSQSSPGVGLMAPVNLALLPLYIIALLKCAAFRLGMNTRLDDRVFAMCQLKSLPLIQLIQFIYPDFYAIHTFDERTLKEVDGKIIPQPPRMRLSAERLDVRGAYLMDCPDAIFIYIGKNIHPSFCSNVLGVPTFSSIPEEMYKLPILQTMESEYLRNFIYSLQEEKQHHAMLQIIREDSHFRTQFTERLIEDRFESALSYYEFLQHLKTEVK